MTMRSANAPDEKCPIYANSRWLSLGEVIAASLIIVGDNVLRILPNSVLLLFVMALISCRLRTGGWTAIGLVPPKSWSRTILFAFIAAVAQQALGTFLVDPLLQPLSRYSAGANPLEGVHGSFAALRWLGIIWTYAAFGEEIGFRGYLLNRVADIGSHSRTAVLIGLIWSSSMFGVAHWYQGPPGVIGAAVSGLIFGSVYLATGKNLWVSVFAHGFSDSMALLATLLAKAGR